MQKFKEITMATSTTNLTTKPAVEKVAKIKKPAPSAIQRVTDILKRATLAQKITAEELDQVAALSNSLKVFLQS